MIFECRSQRALQTFKRNGTQCSCRRVVDCSTRKYWTSLRAAPFHGVAETYSYHGHQHVFCCVPERAEMFTHGQVRFLFDGAQMFTEPVPEPASGFANVRQSACTTSNKVNEVTRRARKSLSDRQRATRGVLIWGNAFVWAQVLHRGRLQGKVPVMSSPVLAFVWRLLRTKESRRSLLNWCRGETHRGHRGSL